MLYKTKASVEHVTVHVVKKGCVEGLDSAEAEVSL